MAEKTATQGLSCPKCGGMVPIPEGQVIVACPFCEQRAVVRGERGLRRYQVPLKIDRASALEAVSNFLGGHWAIARNARSQARISEAFVAYLPFWTSWSHTLAWVFGEKQVGSGDNRRYEPREVKVAEDMTWNGAACDVGEFGVSQVSISDQQLDPYNPDALHRAGLVFEPIGSMTDASVAAEQEFGQRARARAGLDRVSQVYLRAIRKRMGIVYYPLWVVRYVYRGRTFQVAVDGNSAKVLYGKAPGNTLYRAAVLVGGMAAGAVLTIDVPALLVGTSGNKDNDFPVMFLIGSIVVGIGLMLGSYRSFRYGEQYEYRAGPKKSSLPVGLSLPKELGDVMNILEKIR